MYWLYITKKDKYNDIIEAFVNVNNVSCIIIGKGYISIKFTKQYSEDEGENLIIDKDDLVEIAWLDEQTVLKLISEKAKKIIKGNE